MGGGGAESLCFVVREVWCAGLTIVWESVGGSALCLAEGARHCGAQRGHWCGLYTCVWNACSELAHVRVVVVVTCRMLGWGYQECEQRERRRALGLPYSASDQVRSDLSDSPLLATGASVALRGFDCLVLSEWSCGGVEGCGRTNAAVSLDCLDCV